MYTKMISLIAPTTGANITPVTNRYIRDLNVLTEWMNNPARDEDWAYTIRTAIDGINALIRWDFDTAEVAFTSVIEQCS